MTPDLAGAIARHAQVSPRRPALRQGNTRLDYAAFAARVACYRHHLATTLALPRGARVAYLGLNTPDELALLFACAGSACVMVPLNWRLAPTELDTILDDCAPALLCVEDSLRALAAQLGPASRALPRLGVASIDPAWPAVPVVTDPAPACAADPAAPLLLCYTSGTTGRAKGAVLTAATIAANARNAIDMHAMTADDRVLTVLPLFHVGGLNIQTTPALLLGAEVLLLPRFEPGATLDAIASERPTLTVQVPATLQALAASPRWAGTDLSSLRAVTTGSTDVPLTLIAEWHARNVPVIQVYGATETGPVTIYQKIPEAYATVGSIGRPAPGTAIRLVAEDGSDCAPGTPGEIWVRGEHVIRQYWQGANPETFVDGWFRSGDVAVVDSDGRYWFRDRLKNVIISGGENIYPAEIERVLRDAPGVAELAVVGRPDPAWGSVPVAVVVASAEGFDCEALLRRCADRLARYKWPRAFVTVDALPRTALGKVDVVALRAAVTALERTARIDEPGSSIE